MNMITELRTATGLSMTKFAKRVGLSTNAISFYEAYRRAPGWKTALMLSHFADEIAFTSFSLDVLYKDFHKNMVRLGNV